MRSHFHLLTVIAGLTALVGAAAPAAQFTITPQGSAAVMPGDAAAAPMPRGTGGILGAVLDATGNRPVAGAVVTLTRPGSAPVRIMADAQGQFAFRDLPAGRFSLAATRPGYIDGAYGRVRPSGSAQSIDLAADQRVTDATIPLWKFAVITGRLTDESGDPIVNAAVHLLKRTTVGGTPQFVNGPTGTTDDRGMYRVAGVEPGEYLVVVPMTQSQGADFLLRTLGVPMPVLPPGGGGGRVNATFAVRMDNGGGQVVTLSNDAASKPEAGMSEDGHPLTYQTLFYPGSPTASRATSMILGSGEERSGVDFQLMPVRAVDIRGRIEPSGASTGGLAVSLLPAEADNIATPIETATTMVGANQEFQFTNVAPGHYTLHVLRMPRTAPGNGETTVVQGNGSVMRMVVNRAGGPGGGPTPPLPTDPTLWADVSVTVGSDNLDDITLSLRPGLRVSGRVEFHGSATVPAPEQLTSINLTLESADAHADSPMTQIRGRVESDEQFTTMGVSPGRYLIRVDPPRGWTLRSAMVGGRDMSDTAVEIRDEDLGNVVISFTDRSADVSGTVMTSAGQPDPSAAVIIFPADRDKWVNTGSAPRRLKSVRSGKDGSYSVSGLPAGDYFVGAVSDALAADWQNPDFLTTLSRTATRLSVSEGDKKTQSLTTARVP